MTESAPKLGHTQSKKRRQKARMFVSQGGKCAWCGVDMMLHFGGEKQKHFPPNDATLFHLDSRYSPERGRHQGDLRKALVCRKCAEERSKQNEAVQPLEVLHVRAGQAGREFAT